MLDAYSEWLDIPADRRPPTHYDLLGVDSTVTDTPHFRRAAEERLRRLRSVPDANVRARLQGEIESARDTLIDPLRRQTYDAGLPGGKTPWWDAGGVETPTAPTVPAAGWWQGEKAEQPDVPINVELVPSPPPTPVKASDEWWKGRKAAAPQPATLPVPKPATAPPPRPAEPSAFELSDSPRRRRKTSVAPIVASVVAVLGVAGGGYALWKQPWRQDEPAVPLGDPVVVVQKMPQLLAENKNGWEVDDSPKPKRDRIDIAPRELTGDSPVVAKVDTKPQPKTEPKTEPKPATIVERTFKGHDGGAAVGVALRGDLILSVGEDRHVLRSSLDEPSKDGSLHKLLSPGAGIAIASEGNLAAFCDGGDVVSFDLATGKVRMSFENPRGGVRCLALSADGKRIFTGATDGTVRIWAVEKKELFQSLGIDEKAGVTAVSLSPDGKSIAVGLSDGKCAVWALTPQKEQRRWTAHMGSVTGLAWSPDGKRIATVGDDNLAKVWLPTGTLQKNLAGHTAPVLGVAWFADGRRLATTGIDKQVKLWSEARDWRAEPLGMLPEKAFSIAVDQKDRFVVVGLSTGGLKLLPIPTPPK